MLMMMGTVTDKGRWRSCLLAFGLILQLSQAFLLNHSGFRKTMRRFGSDVNSGTGQIEEDSYFNRAGPWDDKNLCSLLDANKAWAYRTRIESPGFFEELKHHAPKILWIGCSDARVPANEIIGEPPGSVFVHRNIANQVVNTGNQVLDA